MRDLTTLQIFILYNTSRFSSIHYKEVKLYEEGDSSSCGHLSWWPRGSGTSERYILLISDKPSAGGASANEAPAYLHSNETEVM